MFVYHVLQERTPKFFDLVIEDVGPITKECFKKKYFSNMFEYHVLQERTPKFFDLVIEDVGPITKEIAL